MRSIKKKKLSECYKDKVPFTSTSIVVVSDRNLFVVTAIDSVE